MPLSHKRPWLSLAFAASLGGCSFALTSSTPSRNRQTGKLECAGWGAPAADILLGMPAGLILAGLASLGNDRGSSGSSAVGPAILGGFAALSLVSGIKGLWAVSTCKERLDQETAQ